MCARWIISALGKFLFAQDIGPLRAVAILNLMHLKSFVYANVILPDCRYFEDWLSDLSVERDFVQMLMYSEATCNNAQSWSQN